MIFNPVWQALGGFLLIAALLAVAWCVRDAGRELIEE